MAITYVLGFNPKWYFANLAGKPLGGGYMVATSSLNPTQQALVYSDPGGNFPYPTAAVPNVGTQGILIDENGTQGPFYFAFNSEIPTQLYFLEVYDANGIFQWSMNFYSPSSGGGGGDVTEAIDINNLINNNVFYRNLGSSISPLPTFLKLAPSNHTGFTKTSSTLGSTVDSDIIFIKNNTTATDSIVFQPFILGSAPLTGDITPEYYLEYSCTNTPSSETQKCVQFPINAKVQNLSNQPVIGTIWARATSGTNPSINLQIRQFFGDGAGASPDVIDSLQSFNLTSSWTQYTFSGTVPNVAGMVLGGCGNDALFMQVQFLLDAPCTIDITKPTLYLGGIVPTEVFQSYDDIESITCSPRTGDLRLSINNHAPWGWVSLNNGTIGNASSNATTRKNIDTFPLYNLIWNLNQQKYAPMFTSAGVPTAYGASSIADFTANNQLALTKTLGNALSGTSSFVPTGVTYTVNTGMSNVNLTLSGSGNAVNFTTGTPVFVTNSGGSFPGPLGSGNIYYAILVDANNIKLATTLNNALGNNPITLTSNGSGTNTVTVYTNNVGVIEGERLHTMTMGELVSHSHDFSSNHNTNNTATVTFNGEGSGSFPESTNTTGDTTPFNIVQPTVYLNVFMKL